MRRSQFLAYLLAILTLAVVAPAARAQFNDILNGGQLSLDGGAVGGGTPESVVSVEAHFTAPTAARPAMLSITAELAPPYYTYSTTQKPVAATPTKIKVAPGDNYRVVGEFRPNLPPKVVREDEFVFEKFAPEVTWTAPLEVRPGTDLKTLKVNGSVLIQACREGSCLQPTDFAFSAELLAMAEPAAAPAQAATGVYSHPNIHATIRGHLEPAVATPGSTVNLVLTAEPAKDWHIYELALQDAGDLGYKPTLIVLSNSSGLEARATTASDKAIVTQPTAPGEPVLRYHEGRVTWTTPIVIPKDAQPGQYPIDGLIGYQTCLDTRCDLPRAAKFSGTLTVGPGATKGSAPLAFADAKYGEAAKLAAARPMPAETKPLVHDSEISTLPMIILFSLVGGFILNFMPCVLPVIGLKILSFAEQAGRNRSQVLALNLWYTLGSMTVFMVLATLSAGVGLGLRDESFGWGEQFSYLPFNIAMVALVFVFALSFLGVWEIPIPGFVGSGAATELAAREGASGAFAKGVLTTLLATPCSGPALGSVFGFLLNQPPAIIYLVFGCIGLGMSAPYLIIGAFPSLIRFLPKPGAWMDTFKQMMGFVMLATIVFLFTIIEKDYLVPTFAMMVGLWAGCWWIGRTSLVETFARKMKAWTQGAAFAGVVALVAFTWLVPKESIIPWQDFSRTELAKLTDDGHTVLVDFTAEWCLTCKMNLAVAIENRDVRDALAANRVVPLLADYTDGSPEIKSMLESLRSSSIPLLAIFPANDPTKPIVLRDLITKQQLLDAIEKAGPSKPAGGRALTASMAP